MDHAQTDIRVRYAPSPTGPQHLGGIRTALYNDLLAKNMGGKLILRIEDTDEKRFVAASEAYLKEALDWLSIVPDEGPDQGGEFGPYRQSERKEIYRGYGEELVRKGYAYYAFDTPKELDIMRQRQMGLGMHRANYNAITRMTMKNSFTLSEEEVAHKISSGVPYVIRLHVHTQKVIKFYDEIRGWIQVHGNVLDDRVLLKETGLPTYHLANVVDDHLMKISHVIRGEEWLPSTPIHCLIYEGLDWKCPIFAHLPLLLRHDGQGKLSKRSVDTSGIPIFPLDWHDDQEGKTYAGFREKGYLPEAVVNFIALLGWNPGNNDEVMTKDELCKSFSLKRVNKAGVQVDMDKATWFNQCHLKKLSGKELAERYLLPILEEASMPIHKDYAFAVCDLVKNRVAFPKDLWEKHQYFFVPPTSYNWESVKEKWNVSTARLFDAIQEALTQTEVFTITTIKDTIKGLAKAHSVRLNMIMPLIRMAISGTLVGPELIETIALLGKDTIVSRLKKARKDWDPV